MSHMGSVDLLRSVPPVSAVEFGKPLAANMLFEEHLEGKAVEARSYIAEDDIEYRGAG
ncbi:hypothetical protein K438DRAFT_1806915 [Mycena galopus ATCC 62051]|nr:hypothetical protein K438DRAFT_1806915 [Mycena galopus ATCC 62051]